ncbi:DVU_1551 family NTP transferase [Desulfotomaculum sp. 1211_IL3151]|uniref:DVU_1551 family NTP transferase n=1 Tax=Desulfotomaculum sp. 1211_IL3151 TaxID=3084055 RepID=UPI002FD9D47D
MEEVRNIAAIILAAGFSSRMGSFKPLLPLAETTVIEKSVSTFKEAGILDIHVVVGHRAQELIQVLQSLGVNIVLNDAYATGMFSSVQAGVSRLKPFTQAFFLLPGDIPLVQATTVAKLVAAYQAQSAGIVYPCLKGERGHPPLISASYQDNILAWSGEGGLRALLAEFESVAKDVAVSDQGVLLDMDTPDDYQRICKMMASDLPSKDECFVILNNAGVAPQVIRHCLAVAQVAEKIARTLNAADYQLDLDLIVAAALLHDIARGQKGHAQAGSQLLQQLGYPRVAEIVLQHMELSLDEDNINETSVVYLADKLVQEDRPVSLAQRFRDSLQKYGSEDAALNTVIRRLQQAQRIEQEIEKVLTVPLANII